MREIQSSEAKAHLAQLLDDVERGETIIVTRHGRAIARIIPESDCRREDVRRAMAELQELRKTMPALTLEEIRSARHEGHKY
ncbi:antitoxin [Allostella vacuolata]|nr:antitoxin [Stella vacuolata]